MSTQLSPATAQVAVVAASVIALLAQDATLRDQLRATIAPSSTPAPAPPAHSTSTRKRRGGGPTPTPTTATRRAPRQDVRSLSTTSPTDRITVTVAIPDAYAGHVVGRAGTGLRQIHDYSHAKISVSTHIGPSASRAVTIRGTPREVGDAIIAIGRRLAKRRIRLPTRSKRRADPPTSTPRPPSLAPAQRPSPIPQTPAPAPPSGSTTPRPAPAGTPRQSSQPSASGTPMQTTPLPPGTPMEIGAVQGSDGTPRPRQTARRSGPPLPR